jgi:hypothetical protein
VVARDVVAGKAGPPAGRQAAAGRSGAWVGSRLRRVAAYASLGIIAFLLGGLVALQPGVRSALRTTALGRALSLSAGAAANPFQVHPQDLVAPPVAAAGQPISVGYTVAYSGADRQQSGWTATLLLSTSRVVGSDAVMVAEFRESAETSGGMVRRQAIVTVPNVSSGDYLLVLRIAANQAVVPGAAELASPVRIGR